MSCSLAASSTKYSFPSFTKYSCPVKSSTSSTFTSSSPSCRCGSLRMRSIMRCLGWLLVVVEQSNFLVVEVLLKSC
eukprot:2392882-Amphidinium_carterae.1